MTYQLRENALTQIHCDLMNLGRKGTKTKTVDSQKGSERL